MKNNSTHSRAALAFIAVALLALTGAAFMGSIAAFQFAFPGFASGFSFVRSRPLHVALAVAWIFLSAAGGIYYYLPRFRNIQWRFPKWPLWQLLLILVTGTGILWCYANGIFGGREYWEHPQAFAIPIVISWLLLVINFFSSAFTTKTSWPVYQWMWATGIAFFLLTFLESNLWMLPWFRDHLVRDLTVQWKSYGALVGSWNMLVYGTAAFLEERLKEKTGETKSRTAFLLYLLGFTNLLFGWAHHLYTVPSASWIRNVSYVISMSELLILAKLLWNIRSTFRKNAPPQHTLTVRFLLAADAWILLNLFVALAISVPAINLYTHGTHITVAHAMGSAIGINTMILFASCAFIVLDQRQSFSSRLQKLMLAGFWLMNIALFCFWITLLCTGIVKGYHTIALQQSFYTVRDTLLPFYRAIAYTGAPLLLGIMLTTFPLLLHLARGFVRRNK